MECSEDSEMMPSVWLGSSQIFDAGTERLGLATIPAGRIITTQIYFLKCEPLHKGATINDRLGR
jgi:hypothetical protein